MRKCPDEEFFNLTLLSIKMKHKKYAQILALKTSDMYEKCMKEKGMTFLMFYDWIEKEIAKIKYMIKYKRVQNGFKENKKGDSAGLACAKGKKH